jgi:hypothetical protein
MDWRKPMSKFDNKFDGEPGDRYLYSESEEEQLQLMVVELSERGYYNLVNLNDGTLFFQPQYVSAVKLTYGHLAEECDRIFSKLHRVT